MRLTHLMDFYVLLYMQHTLRDAKTAVNLKQKERVNTLLHELAEKLAEAIYAYLFLSCIGEARYASTQRAKEWYLKDVLYTKSRGQVYYKSLLYNPKESIPAISKVFSQPWSSGDVGGKGWKDVIDGMKTYHKLDHISFVDHAADIEHNNGTVFSKPVPEEYIGFAVKFDGHLKEFLNLKGKGIERLVSYTDWIGPLYLHPKVLELVPSVLPDTGLKIKPGYWWEWKSIEWGDNVFEAVRKWKDWAETTYGNSASYKEVRAQLLPYTRLYGRRFLAKLKDPNTVEEIAEDYVRWKIMSIQDTYRRCYPNTPNPMEVVDINKVRTRGETFKAAVTHKPKKKKEVVPSKV